MRVRGVLGVLLMTMTGLSAGAGDKITMNASPQISFAPATVTIRTTIEPDAGNRGIEVVIDSEDFYRSSLVELEGDQAPRLSVVEFRGIPGGMYEVSARLVGQDGSSRAIARKQVDVLTTGAER